MATQMKTDVVRMRMDGEFLLISVDLDSYHFRLSTDQCGCVTYGNVGASHHALGPNIHAIEMKSLKDSRFAMLSVGPTTDPTREDYSAFLELQVASAPPNDVSDYAEFERGPALASGCFSVYARPREDGQSVIIPSHSVGSTDLVKYALPGRTLSMYVPSNDQTMVNHIQNMFDTGEDIVLVFRDNIMQLFEPDEQIVNMTLMFVDNARGPVFNPAERVRTAPAPTTQDQRNLRGPYPDTETGMPRVYIEHSDLMRQKVM